MAQLTSSALINLMATNLADNNSSDITPAKLREVLQSIIDSESNPNNPGIESFTTAIFDIISAMDLNVADLLAFRHYGELYRITKGNQSLPSAGAVMAFDGQGLNLSLTYQGDAIKIVNNVSAEYNIRFEGTAEIKKQIEFTIWIRINGINAREIGTLEQKDDDTSISFSMGAFINLNNDDLVEIYIIPDSNNKDFDLQIGSRLTIIRI